MILGVMLMMTQFLLQIRGQTWHEFEGHCYTALEDRNNFYAGKFSCQQYGSYILEMEAESELQFVQSIIEGTRDQYWVGLEFNNVTDKYYWERDGQEPLPSMWLSDEPNHSGQCVRLTTDSLISSTSSDNVFKLADSYCSSSYRVICEKNVDMREAVNYRDITTTSTNRCPMVTYPTRSKHHCARNCAKNKFCTGFQFNEQTQACTPYRFSVTCATPQASPFVMSVMEYARC